MDESLKACVRVVTPNSAPVAVVFGAPKVGWLVALLASKRGSTPALTSRPRPLKRAPPNQKGMALSKGHAYFPDDLQIRNYWQPGNLKLAIRVLQLKVPLDFRY